MKKSQTVVFLGLILALVACGAQEHKSSVPEADDKADKGAAAELNLSADKDLDVLSDYDRDLWDGPAGWSEAQWRWKRMLKWDRQCDYVGEVDTFDTSLDYQVVRVICVPGSYQPMQYLFFYNPKTNESQQLRVGEFGETAKEILGHISVDKAQSQLQILHLSRGTGDCGSVRKFQLGKSVGMAPTLVEKREQACSETPLSEKTLEMRQDTSSWPLVE